MNILIKVLRVRNHTYAESPTWLRTMYGVPVKESVLQSYVLAERRSNNWSFWKQWKEGLEGLTSDLHWPSNRTRFPWIEWGLTTICHSACGLIGQLGLERSRVFLCLLPASMDFLRCPLSGYTAYLSTYTELMFLSSAQATSAESKGLWLDIGA